MDEEYKVIESQLIHAGRFEIVCDTIYENGKKYPYSYVKMKDCVAVLCITNGDIILLNQYRHTLKSWELEIPAGSVEYGESPYETARKEVLEETGYKVRELIPLGWYHLSVGSTTEKVYLFCAKCEKDSGQKLEALEKIKVQIISQNKFENIIAENKFHQCMGVTAWARYKNYCRGNHKEI